MKILLFCLIVSSLIGCTSEHKHSSSKSSHDAVESNPVGQMNHWFDSTLVGSVDVVDCTLSGGTKTQCYQFTVKPEADHDMGPWCPENISDNDALGGIWPNEGKVHQVDGLFIKNLASFYGDDSWSMYDVSTGKINITNIQECAAVPQVNPEWTNHCMHCDVKYMDNIPNITYTIPLKPIKTDTTKKINRRLPIGVAFNGVKFDVPAPLHMILGAYTIAPFDDCGGHVNTEAGYHYHEHNGCSKQVVIDDHEPMIGLALDGFPLHSEVNDADLDACNGHETQTLGYHYHIGQSGSNAFLECFSGEHGCASEDLNATCDASAIKAGQRPPPPQKRG